MCCFLKTTSDFCNYYFVDFTIVPAATAYFLNNEENNNKSTLCAMLKLFSFHLSIISYKNNSETGIFHFHFVFPYEDNYF